MSVGNVPRGVLEMVHVVSERLAPTTVVIGHFTERLFPKKRRHVIEQSACKHCRGEVASLPVDRVDFLAQADELFEIELRRNEVAQLGQPSISYKQQLAALRMLFDWLLVGHIIEINPAHAVRGPKYVVKKGKTSVLDREDARKLIASIDTTSLVGLRDRALIGTMIYTFARVGAVLQMNVGDYFVQGRRGWVRLHEKNGKEHEAPCHHKLEEYLDEHITAAGIGDHKDGPLLRTTRRFTGVAHRMTQPDAYRMIERRPRAAGIKTKSATIPCVRPASPITSKATGHWKMRRPWRTIPPRAPPSSMTGATMKPRSMNTKKWGF